MTFEDLDKVGLQIELQAINEFYISVATVDGGYFTFGTTAELESFVIGYLAGRASVPESPKEKLHVVNKAELKEAIVSVVDAFWGGNVPQVS